MPTNYKLTYFPLRGRGEPIRWLFAQAGVPFEDHRVKKEDWPALKPKTPMGHLPVLEVDGNKQLAQSVSIARYLGREFGLAGDTSFDQALADMYVDGYVDMISKWVVYPASIRTGEPEAKQKELFNTFVAETHVPFLDRYEKFLAANGTGYFVGKKLTWADVVIAEWIQNFTEQYDPAALKGHPKMNEHMKMVSGLPGIKKYIASRPV